MHRPTQELWWDFIPEEICGNDLISSLIAETRLIGETKNSPPVTVNAVFWRIGVGEDDFQSFHEQKKDALKLMMEYNKVVTSKA